MAPTLTAAVQQFERVLLTLNWAGIQKATITRLDPDGVSRNVRTGAVDDSLVCLGSCAVFDHEAPMDQAVTWQAFVGTDGTIAFDTFSRTVSSSWGSTDTGLAWSNSGTAADFSVSTGAGRHTLAAVNSVHESTLPLGVGDMDVHVDIDNGLGLAPATASIQAFVDGRINNSGNNVYRLTLTYQTSGAVTADLSKFVSGSPTTLVSAVTIPNVTFASVVSVRYQIQGTTIRAKAWAQGTGEPGAWLVATTDGSVTGAGDVALASVRNVGNTDTNPQFIWDNLNVTTPSPLAGPTVAATVPSGGQAWLTHPGHPSYAGTATVTRDGLSEIRPARRGMFNPIGSALPVAVSDVRGGSNGTLIVQTSTAADVTRLRNMLADGSPLLLRQPLTWGGDSWWLSIGDVDINRFTQIATDGWRRWTLPYQRVDRPSGASDGAVGVTYNDLKNAGYANYTALAATGFTYTRLSQAVT